MIRQHGAGRTAAIPQSVIRPADVDAAHRHTRDRPVRRKVVRKRGPSVILAASMSSHPLPLDVMPDGDLP